MKTFKEVESLLSRNETGALNVAIEFLSRMYSETRMTRDNLQGMRLSMPTLGGVPKEIQMYLYVCEDYFIAASLNALSTPMRSLLQRLSEFERRSLTEAQMREMQPGAGAPQYVVQRLIYLLENEWPSVVKQYYSARLQLLRQTDVAEKVDRLLGRKFLLMRMYKSNPTLLASGLKDIDTEIQTLTESVNG
jgi:hypothetical protein